MHVNESGHETKRKQKQKNTCTIVLFVRTYPKNMIMFVFMVRVNISAGTRQKLTGWDNIDVT